MNNDEKHLQVCVKCRENPLPPHQWLCVKKHLMGFEYGVPVHREVAGRGIGCPEHAHEIDESVV